MYENSTELAENKLLLLHIIKSVTIPISNTQLTDIVLENSFVNYFTLQQYITELINTDFLKYVEDNKKKSLQLTQKGENVLMLFKDRISPAKLNQIDEYIHTKIESLKKEFSITADYLPANKDSFIVNLKAIENDTLLLDLKVNVVSKKQAVDLCTKWKHNSADIYNKILNALIDE